jgi:UDP-N-acetylmuramate--alanine ligase
VEADEYAGNFDPFRPSVAVLTSAEWDHPDVFADRGAVVDAFAGWIRRTLPGPDGSPPTFVAFVGDAGVAEVASRFVDWEGRILAVTLADDSREAHGFLAGDLAERHRTGLGPAATLVGRIMESSPDGSTLEVTGLEAPGSTDAVARAAPPVLARLALAGRHNAANALGVAAAALVLGLRSGEIVDGLASFGGVGRRLERKGRRRGVVVFDDYGHHPTAIRATIAAVRQLEPGRRLWVACEPLTFHRTAALLDDLGAALATADAVVIADIWAGRDLDTTVVSSADVAAATARARAGLTVEAPGSVEATADWLAGEVRPGDAVLVMGGGRSFRIAERLLERLAENE